MSEAGPPDAVKALAEMLQAMSRAAGEWLEQQRPVFERLAEVLNQARAVTGQGDAAWWRPCHCLCAMAHPADEGVCESVNAVTTRRFTTERLGPVDVPLCAPCAVAQGVADLARDYRI